jgi:disulfide oxidoreductase YuzD
MKRRFAEQVVVSYLDVKDPPVREGHTKLIEEIENRGLLYPVTVMDGVPIYDGAVSYPAIMRAVGNKIAESETAQA